MKSEDMKPQEISKQLDELYTELHEVQNMHEETVCRRFNTDTKAEYIETLKDEIQALEHYQGEDYEPEDIWDAHGFADEADFLQYKFG